MKRMKAENIPLREDKDAVTAKRPCLVVGIGASVGGQEPLEQIFTAMPADCGVSFVVIMHIPAEGPSLLAGILGRFTSMEVVAAEEGMTLKPDRVHVIPPGSYLTVKDGLLHLEEPEKRPNLPHPIDRFFQSLAGEYGEHAVALILSGFGTDGTAGVRAIREAGGVVMVQEPASSMNPTMPRSAIASGAADFILPAAEIPGKIAELAHGICKLAVRECRAATLDEELAAVFTIVKAKTGHDFSSYKLNTVMRRIERRMALNEAGGLKKYRDFLESNPQEAHALGQEILIGVTSFFRDADAFETLRREVLPRLFADRAADEPLRIWHACCASGEEVYSTAILIREYLDEQRLDVKVQFFATDIDEAAISQARAGVYDEESVAEIGTERLQKFFVRFDGRWQVAKQLREMIVFAHHSLIKDPPFSRLDLLVCRNFLIYLNPDMQKRLISLFHLVLRPAGVLFLGASESVGRHSELFTPIDKRWKIFGRLESSRREDTLFPFTTPVRRLPRTGPLPRPAGTVSTSPGQLAEKLLMERYAPPCVVVNERYEVVHVSTRAVRFLEVPVGGPTRDILRMAREELRPALRSAIYKAFGEQRQVMFRGVRVTDGDDEVKVNVLVEPLMKPGWDERLVLVILEPAVTPVLAEIAGVTETRPGDDTSGEMLIRQLEEQLHITQEQLHSVTEQLETSHEGFMAANEELMSINEEFQSTNEELQSTNEELETSREELQALNEELVTVNAELQGKVEELNQANTDMENLLASSEIATIFLDRQMNIKGFTPTAAEIFNLIPADVSRPFRHLAGKIDWPNFIRDARTVLDGQHFAEQEVASLGGERCYLKRIFPYLGTEGRIDGIVVTFIDISEHKRLEEQTRHLASFPQLNPNPVLEVDRSGTVIFANPATVRVLESLGLAREEAAAFLPADLDDIVKSWDGQTEATLYREKFIRDMVFAVTIFLSTRFDAVRIYAYDITEKKLAEQALAESEQRIRLKLESILSPEGDIGTLELADIIDIPAIRDLLDDFHKIAPMTMAILDLKGKVLVGMGWQQICTNYHRLHPETGRNCIESDLQLSAGVLEGDFRLYKCKNNMWDVVTPIMVGGKHLGNFFLGQFFFEDEPVDRELFRSQARKYGFDEHEYLSALEAVPRVNRDALNTSMDFFRKLNDILSKLSFSNIKLARSLTERDALMASLRESERQQQLFIEHAPAALAMFDREMRYLSVSHRWLSDYGLGDRSLIGESHYDVFPEITDQWKEAHCRGLAGEVLHADGDRFERADGSVQWLRWEIRPWYDATGNIGGIIIFADDITDIKKAEEVLRRYELLAGNSRDIILFLRREDGRILEANTAAVTTYGYDHDKLLGMTVNELRAPETLALTADQMAEADTHGVLFETVHCRRDGSIFPVEVSSQGADISGTRILVSVIRDITERKQAEKALQESELFYRQTLESIPGMVFTTRPDGYCDFQSQQWIDFTGVPMIEHLGDGWNKLLHPDDRQRAYAAWVAAVEGRALYDLEYRVRRNDGTYEWFKVRGRPIRNEMGEIVRWFGTAVNIDDMLKTQMSLQESAERIDLLAATAGELLASDSPQKVVDSLCQKVMVFLDCHAFFNFLVDEKEGRLHLNACAGIPEEGKQDIEWLDFGVALCGCVARDACRIVAEDIPNTTDPRTELVKSFGIRAYACHPLVAQERLLGTLSFGTRSRSRFSDDDLALMKAVADQVAIAMERKQTEEALRQTKEEWERTFNSVPDLIAIMDKDHHIVRANRAMAERLNITAEQCIGRECYLGVHGNDHPPQFCPHSLTLADGREHTAEIHEEKLGGDFLVTTTPLLDESGKMTGTVHVARDITAVKRAEEELRLAHDELEKRVEERTIELANAMNALYSETEERIRTMENLREKDRMLLQQSRLAAMGEMINNIAHQWRQPLNLLGLNIQKLLLYYDLGDFNRDLLASGTEDAMALIKHMSQTIDDFRTFFMADREKTDFNLLHAIQKSVGLILEGLKNDRIDVAMQIDDAIKINGFQNEFCQVIMNILQNARDAFNERQVSQGRITLASSVEKGKTVITITDNAGGIPVEIIDRIFEPYFSTKGLQGTGIGLYMSKQIIETKMEGRVTARNSGEGAEFIIEI